MLAETAVEAARRFGTSPAFVSHEGLTLSYQQFDTLADEAAAGLARRRTWPRAPTRESGWRATSSPTTWWC